jgi:hypothetical protein
MESASLARLPSVTVDAISPVASVYSDCYLVLVAREIGPPCAVFESE